MSPTELATRVRREVRAEPPPPPRPPAAPPHPPRHLQQRPPPTPPRKATCAPRLATRGGPAAQLGEGLSCVKPNSEPPMVVFTVRFWLPFFVQSTKFPVQLFGKIMAQQCPGLKSFGLPCLARRPLYKRKQSPCWCADPSNLPGG